MCGLVGFLGGIARENGNDILLRRMADTLIHRGPDDGGVWCDAEQRVGLGHRRLAIVDLSPADAVRQQMMADVPCRNGCALYAVAHGGFPQ